MEQKLSALIDRIESLTDEGIKNGSLQPEESPFFRWRLKDFKYGEKGVESSGADGQEFTKPTWIIASRQIAKLIYGSDEYNSALVDLKNSFSEEQELERYLSILVDHAVLQYLNHKEENSLFNKDQTIKRFISDLNRKPAHYRAQIKFQGIILEPEVIDLPEVGVMLRQTKRDDLEEPIAYYGPFNQQAYLGYPSTIGRLSFVGHYSGIDVQYKVEKLTALLRLFKVGSVKHLSYSMHTDSFLDTMARGTSFSGNQLIAIESGYIKTDDKEKLKKFIQTLDPLLPHKFYRFGEGEVSHVTIAFDRYNDALLRSGILEERIANAVMGLEAILLEATQELSYRLGLRIAKVLSVFGEDGKQIRETIKDAYRIRNLFAHGGHLSAKERRKFENRYGSLDELLKTILEYLRRIIVIAVVVRENKDTLIFLIDDAFIDKEAENQLTNRLTSVRNIL